MTSLRLTSYRAQQWRGNNASVSLQDDDSELPQQLIFIQSFETISQLRQKHRQHEMRVEKKQREHTTRTCPAGATTQSCSEGGAAVTLPQQAVRASEDVSCHRPSKYRRVHMPILAADGSYLQDAYPRSSGCHVLLSTNATTYLGLCTRNLRHCVGA